MSFNDNNKGRTSKKKKNKKKMNMKQLGAKGGAMKANVDMDRDLEDFPTRVRELGSRWSTRHASATPNAEGDIVSVLCSSGAFVIASDTARMKSPDRKLPVSLFDVRVTKNHTLSVCMLSQVTLAPLSLAPLSLSLSLSLILSLSLSLSHSLSLSLSHTHTHTHTHPHTRLMIMRSSQ